MKSLRILFTVFALTTFSTEVALANDDLHNNDTHKTGTAESKSDITYHPHKRHHISILTGGTNVPSEDKTAFTLGLDYEYRLNRRLGLGLVVERAFGEIDSTTLLAVADIHVWRGFVIQVGPGIEFLDEGEEEEGEVGEGLELSEEGGGSETFAIGRIGALYEFEVGETYTISPQLHYDISSGADAIVFGLAFGRAF